ncbi:MAG: trigger factor [Planctomycetota bacterium]|jgi:trigger factor
MAEDEQVVATRNTVTIEDAGPCRKKVIVEIPEETIKGATDEQYEDLRKDALVPGFRKGRAPRRLLEKRFGKEVKEQIKLKLLADASDAALKDNELDALREPDIDFEKIDLPETGSMKFEFEIEVRPEFDLPELEGIKVNKTRLEITDEQIDRELEQLRKWSGVWTPRDGGKVELEDQIIADAVLKAEDVEEEEKLDNIEIFVRPSGFVGAIPVEKLDELLVGAKAGDTKQTTVEVPKTYFRQEYRGKKVDIQIDIKDIKWLRPAPLNEDFLSRYQADDEAELREKIHDSLQSRLERQARTEMAEQIYKYLLDNTDFDLPLDIVADHSTSLLQRQYSNLLMRGLPREQIEQRMEQLQAGSEERAKEQLKTFFIMDKVAEKLELEVTDEEINGHIAQLAIERGQRPERMREDMVRDGSLAQFRLQVREDKCVAKLLESAKITEVKPGKARKTAKKAVKRAPRKAASAAKKQPVRRKTAAKKKTKD